MVEDREDPRQLTAEQTNINLRSHLRQVITVAY